MTPAERARCFATLSECLARAAKAPGLRDDPGLLSDLHASEHLLRELRTDTERLAAVESALTSVRKAAGPAPSMEQLHEALAEAYERAAPHLSGNVTALTRP